MAARPEVVVIGAGPAGLATLKALADRGIAAICFDAGDRPGGLWVFNGPSSGAYRTLHLNTSRTRTQYADFPMPADWPDYPEPRPDPGLPHGLRGARSGCATTIRPGHTVTRVRRDPDGGGWTVTADGPEGSVETRTRAVVVASGHNSVPRWPDPALDGFAAAQLHSHDYRDPEQLAGRRVLVVGGGNSAMDIAADASYVADRTILSMRRGVWIVPKYLFGRPSDTLNGALATRLPWRLRQAVSQTMLRLATGHPTAHGLPAPRHGFLQDHPTLSDVLAVPRRSRRNRHSRRHHQREGIHRGVRGRLPRRGRPRRLVHRLPRRDPLSRPTGRRRPGAPVPARLPPRRARPVLRRPDAVDRRRTAHRRVAGATGRGVPRRRVRPPVGRGAAHRPGGPDAPRTPPVGRSPHRHADRLRRVPEARGRRAARRAARPAEASR